MSLRHHFLEIKRLFFRRWDRQGRWKVSTRSRRRVHGHCDLERRVIEIVIQHTDLDKRDRLLIHEICHAVASPGHGKVWQARMEQAARRADELGRHRLAQLLRKQIVNYQEAPELRQQAYQTVQDWVAYEPDLTLAQVNRSLANEYGLLVSEVCKVLPRTEKVYWQAKQEAEEMRALRQAWLQNESKGHCQ